MGDVKKIVLYGPESTGKSSLALALATHFEEPKADEFARFYLETKKKYYDLYQPSSDTICAQSDILPIVMGQLYGEHTAMESSKNVVFLDTNPLQTHVYVQHYYDTRYKWLEDILRASHYDLYILCNTDLPWVPDPLRDRADQRETLFSLFENELVLRRLPYKTVKGDFAQRLREAIAIVEEFLER